MPQFRLYTLFFLFSSLCSMQTMQPMYKGDVDALAGDLGAFNLQDAYYSDSEDEAGYAYPGIPPLVIGDEKRGKECTPLVRGIHFSPSKFNREEISALRKANGAGEDMFSSAAYDLADEPLGSNENTDSIREAGLEVRATIHGLSAKARHRFQQLYSNQYYKFHDCLGTAKEGGIFESFDSKENPQVSTAENFYHAYKYASGLKMLGGETLDPAYDAKGKPKHPYLGKLFVVLASTEELEEQDAYFVVHGHANDDITVFHHFSNNVLEEREVSFPGFVPGNCVVFSIPIRVPSFEGEYKSWYKEKFGLTKRAYTARKKILVTGKYFKDGAEDPEIKEKTVKSLLEKIILPHAAASLKEHVAQACEKKDIRLVYKQLDGTFGKSLPSIPNANALKKQIKQQKAAV